jgi:hypothetical protein
MNTEMQTVWTTVQENLTAAKNVVLDGQVILAQTYGVAKAVAIEVTDSKEFKLGVAVAKAAAIVIIRRLIWMLQYMLQALEQEKTAAEVMQVAAGSSTLVKDNPKTRDRKTTRTGSPGTATAKPFGHRAEPKRSQRQPSEA